MDQNLFLKHFIILFFLMLASLSPALAQESSLELAANTITEADMSREINLLSHDSLVGRNTPGPEIEKAAAYLADRFLDMGLEPAGEEESFFHRYNFEPVRFIADSVIVKMKGSDVIVRHGFDYFMTSGAPPIEGEPVYIGIAGEAELPENVEGKIFIFDLPGATMDDEWGTKMGEAVMLSMANQALGIIFIMDPVFPSYRINDAAFWMAQNPLPIPVVGMGHEAAEEMFSDMDLDLAVLRTQPPILSESKKIIEIRHQQVQDTLTAPNVVGMLRGSDPTLRDTYIVLTAHFDHTGMGASGFKTDSIFNGANDNASGTAAILEIAEAFKSLPEPPARSVIFLAVTGEEKGLLGTKAYVANPPGIDIKNVVANLNIDMIGLQSPDTILAIGQENSSLQVLVDRTIKNRPELGLTLALNDYEDAVESRINKSDQWLFVKKKIPVIFLHDGDSEYHHHPKDEAMLINFDKAARVAKLAFYLAHAMAMDPQRPVWTEEGWKKMEKLIEVTQY